jgi:hypothetical protein
MRRSYISWSHWLISHWPIAVALAAFTLVSGSALAENGVTITGKIAGGANLLNSVWSEAANPDNHRFTFRQSSTTVAKKAKILRAFLPKELCIAVLLKQGKAKPLGRPVVMHLSGGRTNPSTLVIPEGQNVEFRNHDPFRHKLYDTGRKVGGLGPEEMARGKARVWLPPKAGTYEIRDELFPSVRSWIVVEPRAAACGHVDTKNVFSIPGLAPGTYELRGYFEGKPVGKPLPLVLNATPAEVAMRDPLVVAVAKKKSGSDKQGQK